MDKEELKQKNPELYRIAIEGGTEAPFSGKLKESSDGTYYCAVCGNPLFKVGDKFESGTGWPSFDKPVSENSVDYKDDSTYGMKRTEVLCKKCGSHLGHVFDDGPSNFPDGRETTGKRFCMNSVCLDLKKEDKK